MYTDIEKFKHDLQGLMLLSCNELKMSDDDNKEYLMMQRFNNFLYQK